ncbi:TRAP transporter large permease [Actinobacteria bacterium YIM 96077]|uniref:L-dehydroascorbate transporter large permease subunit n=1 Tax=Phytoactinopolyspora halophila TaxID=1981511 RepID=A0A329QKT5_9ACTN|nr:TRAP transporter large permease [Phytoactinopolyspora halophila]AYY12596.1 TRAP transporter large permease [Actinobacteria bacterium YIM 96077]RAW12501.1 L-dehydroascorbate transporter large permease subunit [Phytoactinopolyspora halophila]
MLWIFLAILFGGILIGIPVSFTLGLSAVVLMFLMDVDPAVVVEQAIRGVNSFPLLAVPFFILVGEVMSRGGIARRLVELAQACVGFVSGGLGQVNVAASMFFGGISGSAVADTSAIGGMMIPAMKEQRYTGEHATAITVSSAVIGILIPPSIPMILFGIVTETSITRLFIAGVIPGLLVGLALMIATFVTARVEHAGQRQRFSLHALAVAFRRAFLGLLLPVMIVGGILGGVFTPTEAAVAAAIYSLLISLVVYRELKPRDLVGIAIRTARLTGMVLFLLAMAMVVAWLLTTALVPQELVEAAGQLTSNPYAILGVMAVLLLAVGVVMDLTPAILILAPIMTPTVVAAGIDPVYFGVIMSFVLGIGLATPPVGTVLYVGCAVGRVKMEGLVRNMLPFYGALLAVLVLLIAFPQLVLWLPGTLG